MVNINKQSQVTSLADQDSDLNPSLLTTKEAAQLLGTSERHVRELWSTHQLSAIKVGRRVRFHPVDIVDYVNRHRVSAR